MGMGAATVMLTPHTNPTISWSEIRTWTTCRQKHHWSYVRNLQRKALNRTPTLGICGHVAIAAILQGKPWEPAVDEWRAELIQRGNWWDEDLEEIDALVATVKAIIPRYLDQYPVGTDFRAVVTEKRFQVRIPRTNLYFEGYWDAIVEDSKNRLWLMDHKFVKQFRTKDDLYLDGQIGIYHYAAVKTGYPIAGTIYNQILSKAPKEPVLTKSGAMSRADITCDWPTYRKCLVDNGLDPADYQDMRAKLSSKKFFDREYLLRSEKYVATFLEDVRRKAMDARRKNSHVYMSSSAINCNGCEFRELCLATVHNADVEAFISADFMQRERRKPEESEEEGTDE